MKITGSPKQFAVLFGIFFVVLTILVVDSFGQDLILIDSVKAPVVETYDTVCQCYPDSMVVYSWLDDGEVSDTIALQFGYTRLGNSVWTTTVLIADSVGGLSINPFIMHHLDPYDVSRDGRVSILDVALLLNRLFINP